MPRDPSMASRAREELGREIKEWWLAEQKEALKLPPLRKFWRFVDWERIQIMKELPNLVDADGSPSRIVNTILARTVPDFAQWLATWDGYTVLGPLDKPPRTSSDTGGIVRGEGVEVFM